MLRASVSLLLRKVALQLRCVPEVLEVQVLLALREWMRVGERKSMRRVRVSE